MKRLLLILILIAYQASATVEDLGNGPGGSTSSVLPTPYEPSLPSYLPSPCAGYLADLTVSVNPVGPKSEPKDPYITQGKTLEFLVNVKNNGPTEVEAKLSVSSKNCPPEWFSWTTISLQVPSGGTRSEKLLVAPDMNAVAGLYIINVNASGRCCRSGSGVGNFRVQDLDYASETAISGTGLFQLNKDVRSMNSGIKSNKEVLFSGTVDALIKNEYLVDHSKGRNPNFEEQDAVDSYNALRPGDSLIGTESFKSSAIFGGVGAKLLQSYNVQQMEFKSQSFNLQTGSEKKTAEFKTADNFTGFYLIDAKQITPGQKSLKEHEEYLGSFEINRRILFRNQPTFNVPCFEADCVNKPNNGQGFNSPCSSSSCNKFADALDAFSESV
jgi:hypothetical protein